MTVVDALAGAYGWRKTWILEDVYFDELFVLLNGIKKRKFLDYQMQLAIVTNPHLTEEDERRALWDSIAQELERDFTSDEKLDHAEIDRLKLAMAGNPRIVIK